MRCKLSSTQTILLPARRSPRGRFYSHPAAFPHGVYTPRDLIPISRDAAHFSLGCIYTDSSHPSPRFPHRPRRTDPTPYRQSTYIKIFTRNETSITRPPPSSRKSPNPPASEIPASRWRAQQTHLRMKRPHGTLADIKMQRQQTLHKKIRSSLLMILGNTEEYLLIVILVRRGKRPTSPHASTC